MVDLVFFCRDNSLSLSQGTEICRARQISGRARSAMVRFTLDVDNSLSYGTAKADDYTWLSTIGQDVLKVWPDEYDNDPPASHTTGFALCTPPASHTTGFAPCTPPASLFASGLASSTELQAPRPSESKASAFTYGDG